MIMPDSYGNEFWGGLKNALTFSLFIDGIPMVYYGDEQSFGGGNDPANREPLWTNMNTNHEIYKMLKTAISVRKQKQVWDLPYREAWVDDSLYVFSKGTEVLPVFHIGDGRQQSIQVPNF